jgi:hypothetical protein
MQASAALLNTWVTGSTEAAATVLDLARQHPAPWWEMRAFRALGDLRAAAEVAKQLGCMP